MRRKDLQDLSDTKCTHAGLLLDRGFKQWDEKGEDHSVAVFQLHQQAAEITKTSDLYKKSYEQWYQIQLNNYQQTEVWFAKLENRMFLGMGTASPIEAGISLHHTYGIPYIPGSAIKGVLHHYAQEVKIDEEIQNLIFGRQANQTDRRDSRSSGYVIFNNAWWIPQGKPALTPEVITVNTQEYYNKKGTTKLHPDFEKPNPNPQIAIQGSFLFSIEGDKKLARYTIEILKKVLQNRGIGGKISSGYGYFKEDERLQKDYGNQKDKLIEDNLPPEAQLEHKVNKLTLDDLPTMIGKSRNNTKKEIGDENWDVYLELVKNKFQDQIQTWNNKKTANPNQVKAYKTIFANRSDNNE